MKLIFISLSFFLLVSCSNNQKQIEEINRLRIISDSLNDKLSNLKIAKDTNHYISKTLDLFDFLILETKGNSQSENYQFYISNKLGKDGNGYKLQFYLIRVSMPIYKKMQDSSYLLGLDPRDDSNFRKNKEIPKEDFAEYYFLNKTNEEILINLYKLKIKTLEYIIQNYGEER